MIPQRTLPAVLAVVLVVAVCASVVLKGAVEPRHLALVGVPILLAAVVWVVQRPQIIVDTITVRVLAALLALTLLPLVPLPPFVYGALSSRREAFLGLDPSLVPDGALVAAELATMDLDAALQTAPQPLALQAAFAAQPWTTWRPLAVAPQAALDHALAWGLAGVTIWLAAHLSRRQGVLRIVAVGLLLLGIAESAFGIANMSGGSLGIAAKEHYLGSATGTLVNRNHFGALLGVCLGATWGMAGGLFPLMPRHIRAHYKRRNRSSTPPSLMEAAGEKLARLTLLAFLAAVMGVAMVATRSRGALLGFGVATLLVGTLTAVHRGERFHLQLGVGLLAASLGLGVAAFGLGGALGRFRELFTDLSSLSRLDFWDQALQLWMRAPFLGWGAGAFDRMQPSLDQGPWLYRAVHVHNDYLQMLAEQGGLFVVGLVALVVVWGRASWRLFGVAEEGHRTALAVGLSAGAAAMLVQAAVDFPFQVPGTALVWSLAVGAASGALATAERGNVATLKQPIPLAVAFGLGALVLGVRGIQDAQVHEAEVAYRQALGSRPEGAARSRLIRARNSASGTVEGAALSILLASHRGEREAWDEAIAYAERAVRRDPLVAAAHLMHAHAAVGAVSTSPDEASRERYRAVAEAALARAVHLQGRNPGLLLQVAELLVQLGSTGSYRDAYVARATRALQQVVVMDPWKAAAAFEVAERLPPAYLRTIQSEEPRVLVEMGRALLKHDLRDEARATLARAWESDPDLGAAAFHLAELARREGAHEESAEWLERFLAARQRPVGMEGWALYRLGRYDSAEVRFREGLAHDAGSLWLRIGLGRALLERGRLNDARVELEKARERAPQHAEVAMLLKQVQALSEGGEDSLLRVALETGDLQGARAVLQQGADPAEVGEDDQPILIAAVHARRPDFVQLLVAFGADPNPRDRVGAPALAVAAKAGHLDVVTLLLELGADPALTDGLGRTARDLAKDPAVLARLDGVSSSEGGEGASPGVVRTDSTPQDPATP